MVPGINDDGKKEVLSIVIGENESSKFWLGVLNSLKNRGDTGYPDPVLGWAERDQRCDQHSIP